MSDATAGSGTKTPAAASHSGLPCRWLQRCSVGVQPASVAITSQAIRSDAPPPTGAIWAAATPRLPSARTTWWPSRSVTPASRSAAARSGARPSRRSQSVTRAPARAAAIAGATAVSQPAEKTMRSPGRTAQRFT